MSNVWRYLVKVRNARIILFMAIIPSLTFWVYPNQQTLAQDGGICFMEDSQGRKINLGSLCGVTPVNPGFFRIPIKKRRGRTPVIDVTFNGEKTFEMILDTGASSTLITQEMAASLRLKMTDAINARIADGTNVQFYTGRVNTVSVGGVIVKNLDVAVAPRADIGLLGHDFFNHYDIKILEKDVEFYKR